MKTFSKFVNEAKKTQIEVQDDSVNYLSVGELKKYLSICDKFLSQESKDVINWLIVNNDSYIKDFATSGSDNALADFYNDGPYKEPDKKELYAWIGKINKSGRLLEIPVFQTRAQIDAIISGEKAPDDIIIDLTSERGRQAVAKKYEKLCHKMASSFKGKSNLEYEDLLASAFEGLTYAMNSYGKKSVKAMKREEATGEELDISNYKTTTFLSYAAHVMRYVILEAIKNESHLVRIPASVQSAERKEKGHNTKSLSVSGDKSVSGEEGGKTLFDFIDSADDSSSNLDNDDIEHSWKLLFKKLKENKKITPVMIKCWMECNELGGVKKRKAKDIAAELNLSPSNITYYNYIVNKQIKDDPELSKIAKHLIFMYNEALQNSYNGDMDEPIRINMNDRSENTDMD